MGERRVAVMVASGFEEIEGLTVVDVLRRAQVPCDTVSVERDVLVTGSHGIPVVCDRTISDQDFSFDDYHMLVLPGGMPGTLNLAGTKPLCDALRAFAKEGRPLAAICAAPTVLAGLGILDGRRACCYPGMEDQLSAGGAIVTYDPVTLDGPITTSRGMGTAIDFALALVGRLQGTDVASRLSASIVHAA